MSIVEKKSAPGDGGAKWEYNEVFTSALTWDENMWYDNAKDWREAIDHLLSSAKGTEIMARVRAICVSGTSATCLLVNRDNLSVSRGARMYNYDILSSEDPADNDEDETPADRVMKLIDEYVPEKHTARATTGSLAKLLLWNEEEPLADSEALCHQSDYVSMSLMREGLGTEDLKKCATTSDWHNCLKLGYDMRQKEFPG